MDKHLEGDLIVLDGREVENLLPPQVLRAVVADYENKELTDIPEPDQAKYLKPDQYMGDYIEGLLQPDGATRKGGYKADSGTLKAKLPFCRKACAAMNELEFSDLDEKVQKNIRRMDTFIRKQNGLDVPKA